MLDYAAFGGFCCGGLVGLDDRVEKLVKSTIALVRAPKQAPAQYYIQILRYYGALRSTFFVSFSFGFSFRPLIRRHRLK